MSALLWAKLNYGFTPNYFSYGIYMYPRMDSFEDPLNYARIARALRDGSAIVCLVYEEDQYSK